jgi:hypothetical protein
MLEGSCDCGQVRWRFDRIPESATACSCTLCRRYGVLWGYDYEDEAIHVSGPTSVWVRGDRWIGFHFCPTCGCVAYWRAVEPQADGRRRMAVNLRLAEPEPVVAIAIRRFDGLETYKDLPSNGRCVGDYWF